MLTLEIFNCVVKTVLFKPTELVDQNEGQCVGWKGEGLPEKIKLSCCLPFLNAT